MAELDDRWLIDRQTDRWWIDRQTDKTDDCGISYFPPSLCPIILIWGIRTPTNCLSVHLLTLYIMKIQRNYCQSITNAHIYYWHFHVSFPGLCFWSAGKLFHLVCQPYFQLPLNEMCVSLAHWAVLVSHGWLFKLQEQVLFLLRPKSIPMIHFTFRRRKRYATSES